VPANADGCCSRAWCKLCGVSRRDQSSGRDIDRILHQSGPENIREFGFVLPKIHIIGYYSYTGFSEVGRPYIASSTVMPRKFVMGHSVGEVAAGLIVPLLVLNCRMSLKARSLSFSDILLRGRNRNTSRLNQMPFGSLALNLIELVLRSSGEGPTMASFGGASERASNLVLLVADQPSRNRKYPQKLHLS
jgi:hypothetical protein